MKTFAGLTDEELAVLAKVDERAMTEIIKRFEPMIGGKVQGFYLTGGDRDDLMQAGRMAVIEAVRAYDPAKGGSFRTLAALSIKRRLIDAVKADNKKGNVALNEAVSIEGSHSGEDDAPAIENVISTKGTPEQNHIERESYDETVSAITKNATELELTVLTMYLDGLSYANIASEIGRDKKFVDNTIQKLKRKIRDILAGR